jgi:ribosomal-protein-alanine N-acetyltransferase
LCPQIIHALAESDLVAANLLAPVVLTPWFVSPESVSSWRYRSADLLADPAAVDWSAGALVVGESAVGRAGFHGPPDAAGMVEIGYAVAPEHRRRGYARAGLEALLTRARSAPAARIVRATIEPDNVASSSLVLQYGFVVVGKQWDDEDGLELVYQLPV